MCLCNVCVPSQYINKNILGQGVEEMLQVLAGHYCCSCISWVRVLRICSMDWQATTVVHVSAVSGC